MLMQAVRHWLWDANSEAAVPSGPMRLADLVHLYVPVRPPRHVAHMGGEGVVDVCVVPRLRVKWVYGSWPRGGEDLPI